MSGVSPTRLIEVLKRAESAGVDPDRRGLVFKLGWHSDAYSVDGPPAASTFYDWAEVRAGGEVVLVTHPWKQVEGPWLDDLPGVLEQVEAEAGAVLARRAAEQAANEREKQAQAAERELRQAEEQRARYLRERDGGSPGVGGEPA